jgi:hypothetical protein
MHREGGGDSRQSCGDAGSGSGLRPPGSRGAVAGTQPNRRTWHRRSPAPSTDVRRGTRESGASDGCSHLRLGPITSCECGTWHPYFFQQFPEEKCVWPAPAGGQTRKNVEIEANILPRAIQGGFQGAGDPRLCAFFSSLLVPLGHKFEDLRFLNLYCLTKRLQQSQGNIRRPVIG